jgi:glutaredoxin 3
MIELFQTEWCPSSRRVRERLTELGIDYVSRQVPAERDDRAALRARTGSESIPALLLEDGSVVVGSAEIIAFLEHRAEEPGCVEAHRAKAAQLRRRYLEEECGCMPPAIR